MKSSLEELSACDMRSHILPSTHQPERNWLVLMEEVVMSVNAAMLIPRYTNRYTGGRGSEAQQARLERSLGFGSYQDKK